MKVTSVSGNDFTVVRAAEPVNGSSVAASHNNGAQVVSIVTAGQLEQVASPGALVLLEQQDASASATLDFVNWHSSAYDEYIIELVSVIPATNAVIGQLLFSTNGGSSYDTGSNYNNNVIVWLVDVATAVSTDGAAYCEVQADVNNTALYGMNFSLKLNNLSGPYKSITGTGTSTNSASGLRMIGYSVANWYLSTNQVDAFRFKFSSGNIASGTIRVYGVSKIDGAGIDGTNAISIRGVEIDATAPTDGQVLQYDSSEDKYVPTNLNFGKNEFYWPPPVPAASTLDLDAAAQWWRKVGTPTGGVIYTTATTEAISTTYGDELLKVVSASSGDGLKTTWTYANEKRVKSGQYMAALCAIYIVTASRTATVSLVTSTPTTIASASISTVGSWVLVPLESASNTLDGSSVDFKVTLDGAGTFYVVPLGALVSSNSYPTAVSLSARGYVFKWSDPEHIKDLTGLGDEATWTDIDTTSASSALAVAGHIMVSAFEDADSFLLFLRRNGSSDGNTDQDANEYLIVNANPRLGQNTPIIPFDDGQVFEYYLDRVAGSGTLGWGWISLSGWWEWA